MSTNLSPVVCKNEAQVGDAAFDGVRRRPVVAINEEGKLVVCCRRTAAKNGWQVQASMFQRKRPEAVAAKKPARRATDNVETVVVPKAKVAKVKAVIDAEVDSILGDL